MLGSKAVVLIEGDLRGPVVIVFLRFSGFVKRVDKIIYMISISTIFHSCERDLPDSFSEHVFELLIIHEN